MKLEGIKPGSVVHSTRWPEPVVIDMVEDLGEYVRIVGAEINSRRYINEVLSKAEFGSLADAAIKPDFNADPRMVFLGLEAKRYRFASLYDPLLAVNISKIDPLPHQIEAVYGYILRLPRIRFLIADDPGAGKTIMAGLVIKELKLRHQVRRIMIVAPGHLKDQWQREMKHWFQEVFTVVDRHSIDSLFGENAWGREDQIITSLDFAKQENILPALSSVTYDLIVVDEAHKMSAYLYGDKLDKTARYKLGETLSRITEHLLFLTATPHRGDPENFRLFLDLLEPGFFATTEMLQESIHNNDNPLFIRRVKEDLKDFEGRPLFLPRHVTTVAYDLGVDSPREMELYSDLYDYITTQYGRALSSSKRRNVAFALIILQRRLASSTYALLKSLQRRKNRLEEMISSAEGLNRQDVGTFDWDAVDDMSEEDRWAEEQIWETLSVAENREELRREIETVERLIIAAEEIIRRGDELKLRKLQKTLSTLSGEFPKEKVIIFTESRDTLDYLEKRIRSWGYTVNTIHGGMRLQERVDAEGVFKQETQILVATEAAGEGINLQFCHLMINYDLPWNPNRLEQRMGRIHRYGQTREVFVYNLVARDTREGRVMYRLFEKLEEIREALGSDKVYDILGTPLYGVDLSKLLLEAAASTRSLDEILSELDITVDEDYVTKVKEQLGESLATHFIDYTRIREMAERAKEHRLIPEYTEAFFKKAYDKLGGTIKSRADKFLSIENVPSQLKRISEADSFKRVHGSLQRRYQKCTFDKALYRTDSESEFVSFGHPLFEAVLGWVEQEAGPVLHRGATFTDPDGMLDGFIMFYEGEVGDGKGSIAGSRLFTIYAANDGSRLEAISPMVLWDLKEGGKSQLPIPNLESGKAKALPASIGCLNRYMQELQKERNRQAGVKRKYGVTSLRYLVHKLDGDLIDLDRRLETGESVDLPIRNKIEQKRRYEIALEDLQKAIEQEKTLVMSTPRFVGAVRVLPQEGISASMKSDKEVELVGMQVAMQYERDHGRVPFDVSAENLGYDVRSTGKDNGIRYIEVKARAQMGEILLTQNEWFKAKRFGEDYYIYVVLNASTQPLLRIIRNPAGTLSVDDIIEVVRVKIPLDTIMTRGDD